MTLPRVVVDVARTEDEIGWTVHVDGVGVVESYPMPAIEIRADGRRFQVPEPGDLDVSTLLKRLRTRATENDDVTELGRWLFRCLIGPVWNRIKSATQTTAARGVELALQWPSADDDLHRLNWEAMHDEHGFLAGHAGLLVAITRVVADVGNDKITTVQRVPRVLFAVGDLPGQETIRAGTMFMGLLRAFETSGVCSTKAVEHVTLDSLAKHCAEVRPDLVHLVAHGELGGLRLGGERYEGDQLAGVLLASHRPLAVVVSACGSGSTEDDGGRSLAAHLVARGIPIVSAVVGDVSEQACRLYTKRLVESLSCGTPLAAAAAAGRRAALQHAEARIQLDWAMPTLFVSRSVEPSFQPIDNSRTRWLVEAATDLRLRQPPLFFGRKPILDLVDEIFNPVRFNQVDVVGAVTADGNQGLGGTRLLREIGYRLLMRGHLPVMFGPYGPAYEPGTVRDFAARISQAMKFLAERLDLQEPRFDLAEKYLPDTGAPPTEDEIISAREAFAADTGSAITWERARAGLVKDVEALRTDAARTHPDLFGSHTRLVVLADNLHKWGVLDDVVDWINVPGGQGLGKAGERIPMVFTAEIGDAKAASLKSLEEQRFAPGFAFPQLKELNDREVLVGYQWVLLHPWRRGGHDGDPCRLVYTAGPGVSDEALTAEFAREFGRRPVVLNDVGFYQRAVTMVRTSTLVDSDDEAAWDSYQRTYS